MQARPIKIVTSHSTTLRIVRAATIAVVALACSFLGVQRVNAQSIDHSGGFANHSDFTDNGNSISWPSYTFGTLARLSNTTSQMGSTWWNTSKVDITSFTTTFTFDINDAKAFDIADGLMLVIQNDPNGLMALGCGGGGLGYGADSPTGMCGTKITKSVGVKFDTFKGNDCEVSNNATGLFADGDSPTCPQPGSDDVQVDLTGSGIDLHNDRNPMQATLTYDGTTLTETITNLATMASFTTTYTVNIAGHVGATTAWVGFTTGTGGAAEVADVESWTWTSPSP